MQLWLPRTPRRLASVAGPLWVRWILAMAYAGLAAYCLARLHPRRRAHRDPAANRDPTVGRAYAEGSHGLMATGMAAMFAPVATPVPPVCWAVVFAAHTGWLGLRLARTAVVTAGGGGWRDGRAHLVPHLLAGAVMAAVFAAMPSGWSAAGASHLGHLGHLGAAGPLFALVVWAAAGGFLVQAVRCGVRMALPDDGQVPEPRTEPARHPARGVADAELPLRLAMGPGMSYMLITMF